MMNEDSRKTFSRRLLAWWKKNQRDFPWRHTNDPYSVLIAEMLLRKTTAQQVDGVYKVLISRYPNPKRLSEADGSELVELIKPLGMEHKRARLLKEVGKTVVERHKGVVPSNPEELLQLPGVGLYVANAVLSFSHAQSAPMVDTNFVRLLERVFGFRSSKARARDDKQIWQFAETLVPKGRSKEFNLAVIDFAALVCGAHAPKCVVCPLTSVCVFFRENLKYDKVKVGRVLHKQTIKGADDPKNRDLRIVKTCDVCGALYHPRRNSYQIISRFCSQECARKGRRKDRLFDDAV